MKLLASLRAARCVLVLLSVQLPILAGPAMAAPGECRQIQSRKDRNACYEQQAAEKKRNRPAKVEMGDAVDRMKVEDDALAKRLQGICRGC